MTSIDWRRRVLRVRTSVPLHAFGSVLLLTGIALGFTKRDDLQPWILGLLATAAVVIAAGFRWPGAGRSNGDSNSSDA